MEKAAPLPLLAVTLLAIHSHAIFAQQPATTDGDAAVGMLGADVVVTGESIVPLNSLRLDDQLLRAWRTRSSDTARLLEALPGVSTYSAGGISSLPSVRGLADDRLRTRVDGVDLQSACPNHMNPALSFIDPSKVAQAEVYAGITPVSVGGDSIGGTIDVRSAPPQFATPGGDALLDAEMGFNTRSNGRGRAAHAAFAVANESARFHFEQSQAQADNYHAAKAFKLPGLWKQLGAHRIPEDVVAGSEYRGAINRELGLAARVAGNHVFDLKISEQSLDYEGFANQRMDMVWSEPDQFNLYQLRLNEPANINRVVNLRYTGQYDWGELEAGVSRQRLRHHMDMLPNRFFGMSMPMDARSETYNGDFKASVAISDQDILRLGMDYQDYSYDDWWPPIGQFGAMCCNDFWNIRDGERDRRALYTEWERSWSSEWLTLIGLRGGNVTSNAGEVQGYRTSLYGSEAAAFNARDRKRTDEHLDATALARFMPTSMQTYEIGIARKTRSPNLLERYTWTYESMAASMNNFVGDGNAYIGNLDLKPEVAYTASASADWHDQNRKQWHLKITGYLTHVNDFIDAERCSPAMSVRCPASNVTTTNQFVKLRYINQDARLYGIDLSGNRLIGEAEEIGSFTVNGLLSYVAGENRVTGDDLYHIMPANLKIGLTHQSGGWSSTIDLQAVAEKERVSKVRNEVTTPGYGLIDLRTGYEWQSVRVDFEIENLTDRFYLLPLGGAYIGQGNSMALNAIPWGMSMPGRGRSFNISVNLTY